jgi:hypothetical protein
MYEYLHLGLPGGTKKEPHKYLDIIVRPDYIEIARNVFFTEHLQENSQYSSFPIDVKKEDDKLILDYEVEVEYISEYEAPIMEWRSREYRFRDSLKSSLRIEQLNFIRNVQMHLEGPYDIKSKKDFISRILGIIAERYQSIESSTPHQEFMTEFNNIFSAIAKYIKKDYPSYLPKRFNPIITFLHSAKLYESPPSLKVSIFDGIMNITDKNDKIIFKVERGLAAKNDFKYFLYGQTEKMANRIEITSSYTYITVARYLISRLSFYLGISDKKLAELNVFLLNGQSITARSTYTAKMRVNSVRRTEMQMVDSIIYNHLK